MQNLPELESQLSKHGLFDAFKKQLIKDFEASNLGTDLVMELEPSYSSILEKIASSLQRHEGKADFNIMQLLYRIDISEAQLKKYLIQHKDKSYFQVIAELIIKRVLQKVVIKRFYKNSEASK